MKGATMKKIIKITILFVIMWCNFCLAMVKQLPENTYNRFPNEFYINYHTDRFDDVNYNEPYISNYPNGKYTYEYLKVYDFDTDYVIKFDKYSDANRNYFGIINLFWNDSMYDKYIYKVALKYNNQEYDYPDSIYHFKSTLFIDQDAHKPLYDLIYNLYTQGIPFKMRIDEISPSTLIPATHIIDVKSTNFAEARMYVETNYFK